ncbi:hypothetical protein J2S43_001193 [Catenuloplanes nepalensis]|uniref:Peptidase S8/S53 domain-containing protein n=1 Tax=Catenuloplanes nepalensis TaxID=587533 RepID=A0ABT9MNN8_9ACTN|nr:S8 family serine peptidase [Catenuloplanes nepalensis]MDP9792681.1 hypothetical protein [Catenuloplanes nepalensis]
MTYLPIMVAVLLAGAPPALPDGGTACAGPSPVTETGTSWAAGTLAAPAVWPLTRGAGVTVAVLDTGVSADAPALAGAVRPGTDVVSGGTADDDCRGRGTALAGIVAARPQRGSGVTGMAPDAAVLPIRIVTPDGTLTPAALASGVRAATAAGAGVILIGTGVTAPEPGLRAAVADAVAHDVLVVAAANAVTATAGPEPPVWYPAAFDGVLAVNAVGTDGVPGAVAETAGTDLAAPGAGAVSIGPHGTGHYTVSGTGVAAAFVAGAAVLVRAYHPGLSEAEVRARLAATARPGTPAMGAGLLDAYAAVAGIAPGEDGRPRTGAAAPIVVPRAPGQDAHTGRALAVAAGALAAAGIAITAELTRRRSRRRPA